MSKDLTTTLSGIKELRNSYDKWNQKMHNNLPAMKKCPCCGGEAILQDNSIDDIRETDENGNPYLDKDGNPAPIDCSFEGDIFWVSCLQCGLAQFGYSKPLNAIEAWNKRIK